MTSPRLAPSLVLWINSLAPSLPSLNELDSTTGKPKRVVEKLSDLSDGVVLGDVVGEIDPAYFRILSTSSSNQRSLAENWIIRFNSLKRLYKLLIRYFEDVLHNSTASLLVPNLQLIAKGTEGADEEICKLAGIILALVVQSEQREKYVARIQKLEVWAQGELMYSIEQVMSKVSTKADLRKQAAKDSGEEADSEFYASQNERSLIVNEKELLQVAYEDLINNFNTLKADHEEVLRSLTISEERNAKALEKSKAENDVDRAEAVFKVELDRTRMDLTKVENQLGESELLNESQSREIEELTRRVEDLAPRAEEASRLKDQLDEYKHATEEFKKMESVNEKYKKKLEDSADLRRNIKTLEDQNSELLDKNGILEEEIATISALKPLIESYKSQVTTLETKSSTLTRDHDSLKHEAIRMKEKLRLVESERKKENEALVLYEERVKELELANGNRRDSHNTSSSDEGEAGDELEDALRGNTMTDLKLQIRKLKREIETGKGKKESDSKMLVLENLLEDSERLKGRYEGDYMREHREKLVLEEKLEAIMKGTSRLGDGPEASISLRQRLNETSESLDLLKEKHIALEVKYDSQKDLLTIAQSDLTLVNQDQLTILKSLRASVSTENDSLKANLLKLKESLQTAEDRVKMQLSQVNTLLMEKVALQSDGIDQREKMLEREKDMGDLKVTSGRSESEIESLKEEVERVRTKLEKARLYVAKQDDELVVARAYSGNVEAQELYLAQIKVLNEELTQLKASNAEVEARYRKEQQAVLSVWHDINLRETLRENPGRGTPPRNASWLAQQRARSKPSLRNA